MSKNHLIDYIAKHNWDASKLTLLVEEPKKGTFKETLRYDGREFYGCFGHVSEERRVRMMPLKRWQPYDRNNPRPPLPVTSNDADDVLQELYSAKERRDWYKDNFIQGVIMQLDDKEFMELLKDRVAELYFEASKQHPKLFEVPIESAQMVRNFFLKDKVTSQMSDFGDLTMPVRLVDKKTGERADLKAFYEGEIDAANIRLQAQGVVFKRTPLGPVVEDAFKLFGSQEEKWAGMVSVHFYLTRQKGGDARKLQAEFVSAVVFPVPKSNTTANSHNFMERCSGAWQQFGAIVEEQQPAKKKVKVAK